VGGNGARDRGRVAGVAKRFPAVVTRSRGGAGFTSAEEGPEEAAMPYPTALVLHPDCGLHDTGWGHPEHQGRLPAIINAIHREMPALIGAMLQREATPAGVEDLVRVHADSLVEAVRRAAEEAGREGRQVYLEADTV